MNMDVKKIILLFVIFSATLCQANESNTALPVEIEVVKITKTASFQAFTGVFNTPNTEVISYGDFSFAYSDNYYDQGNVINRLNGFQKAKDLKFGLGIFPNLEIIGRLGTSTIHCNGYTDDNCGFRDLSGSIKYQIPFIPKNWFQLAIGGQDIGGSVVLSQAYYISASKSFGLNQFGSVRTSVGVSNSDNALDYMNGAFGSVEYQPFDLLQVAVEYDANVVNAGVKAFAPEAWLPKGWQVSAAAQLYTSDSDHNEKDEWFSFNLTIPMGSTSPRKSTKQIMQDEVVVISGTKNSETVATNTALLDDKTSAGTSDLTLDNEPSNRLVATASKKHQAASVVTQEDLTTFSHFLANYGFESISIGLDEKFANKLVIKFENNLYNRNEDDAMQVMAKLVDEHLHTNATIDLTNFGLIVKTVQLDFANSKALALGQYASVKNRNLVSNWFADDNVKWLVNNESSAYFVPRLIVAPAVSSLVGTEYGAFDFQLVLSLNAQMSLWPGALVDFRYMTDTIANTDDFEKNKYIYNRFAIRKGIDRRLFHQTFSLPLNVFTQFSYGRIYGNSDGLLNETRWQSTDNLHRVTLLAGEFDQKPVNSSSRTITHQPLLLKYRYRYSPLNWDVELTAGEYWGGDKGFTLRSLHWFDNVQVGLKYRKSKFDDRDGGEEEDFFAIGFSIPLNFNKSMNPKYGFQVKGIEQWNYYVETSLTEKNTGNHIKTGFGQEPALYNNLNQVYFNRDRY